MCRTHLEWTHMAIEAERQRAQDEARRARQEAAAQRRAARGGNAIRPRDEANASSRARFEKTAAATYAPWEERLEQAILVVDTAVSIAADHGSRSVQLTSRRVPRPHANPGTCFKKTEKGRKTGAKSKDKRKSTATTKPAGSSGFSFGGSTPAAAAPAATQSPGRDPSTAPAAAAAAFGAAPKPFGATAATGGFGSTPAAAPASTTPEETYGAYAVMSFEPADVNCFRIGGGCDSTNSRASICDTKPGTTINRFQLVAEPPADQFDKAEVDAFDEVMNDPLAKSLLIFKLKDAGYDTVVRKGVLSIELWSHDDGSISSHLCNEFLTAQSLDDIFKFHRRAYGGFKTQEEMKAEENGRYGQYEGRGSPQVGETVKIVVDCNNGLPDTSHVLGNYRKYDGMLGVVQSVSTHVTVRLHNGVVESFLDQLLTKSP